MGELRWVAPAEGGLFELGRRVVGRGEYRGLTFHEVEARSILNRVRGNFPFAWTINAYRGCSHACVYCFARPTHEYLGFDAGAQFESEIVVKVNAVELVRAETAPGRWGGDSIAMGTNTDPYQPAEGRYRLTRGILEVLVERANPFSLLTKSTLILSDLELIAAGAQRAAVSVGFSIGTLDPEVWRLTEPGTPHPRRRLEAISRFAEAGVTVNVLMAPLIPGMSDRPSEVEKVRQACLAAGATSVSPVELHLRPGVKEYFMEWLAANRPELVAHYRRRYPNPVHRPSRRPPRRTAPNSQPSLPLGGE